MMHEREDPATLRGAHIIGERELSFVSSAQAKRTARRRQNVIFSIMAIAVLVAFIAATLSFTGVLKIGGRPTPVQADEQPAEPIANPACPTSIFNYQDPASFKVRVLNTTTISGLAGRTAEALKNRGFQISATTSGLDRYEDKVAVVLAGPQGYAQALTIQRQVPGSEFVYDEMMYGTEVDLALGTGFEHLVKERKLNTAPGTLECIAQQ